MLDDEKCWEFRNVEKNCNVLTEKKPKCPLPVLRNYLFYKIIHLLIPSFIQEISDFFKCIFSTVYFTPEHVGNVNEERGVHVQAYGDIYI